MTRILGIRRFFFACCFMLACPIGAVVVSKPAFAGEIQLKNISDLSISELSGGRVLWVRGIINLEWEKKVLRIIKKEKYQGIVLDSPGGLIRPARRLARVIKIPKLDTYSFVACVSACTIAFIAGKNRFLATTAKLGFHQVGSLYYQGPVPPRYFESIQNAVKRQFEKRGVAKNFIDTMYDAKHSELWVPTHKELLEAKVVHKVLPPNDDKQDINVRRTGIALAANEAKLDQVSRFSITELAGGKLLWIRGQINYGWSDRVLKRLEEKQYQGIVLDSPEGLVQSARKVAEVVKEQKLDTYSFIVCASACAIPFVEGQNRLLSTRAKTAFHNRPVKRTSVPVTRNDVAHLRRALKYQFKRVGVMGKFIVKLSENNADNLWVPSHDELKQAKLITGVINPATELDRIMKQ